MNFATFKTQKENEFNHWVSFSPLGSGLGISLGFLDENFVPNSDIGSARSGLTSDLRGKVRLYCLGL